MKYLKTYEDTNKPNIGDYVYCEVEKGEYKPNKFIGKLIDKKNLKKKYPYLVKYKINTNSDAHSNRLIQKHELIAFSKNKKDLEHYINANKYNL